ncbi:MAG: T9SS type A sorting domain-containing protein [Saprospiraceae bacterium]|nr:T9SS type A sorting domain-containing protein [Saprospiraceae bacterium]
MKLIYSFLIAIFASTSIYSQTLDFEWAKSIGGDSTDISRCIKVDTAGNIYITGYFKGTVDFDPGTSVNNLTSAGEEDIFIQKLDSNGNFLWAKSVGGVSRDVARSIALDASGFIYITGYFAGTADFDPGTATYNLSSNGNDDVFILKLTTLGAFVWAKSVGGTSRERSYSIALDNNGNIYTTGKFADSADFDPGATVSTLVSANGEDVFILKLNGSGAFVWAKSFAGTLHDVGNFITTDISGNIYVSGEFEGTTDFDPGASTFNLTSNGYWDMFIVKLNSTGDFVWAKSFGGVNRDGINMTTIDNSGNVYNSGKFQNTVDFDPGTATYNLTSNGDYDIFIQKLDASGDFVWAKSIGGTLYDQGESITTDASGNCYLTGYYQQTVDFDPGTQSFPLTSNGAEDIFILKLDNLGDFSWAKSIGGPMSDNAYSIFTDASNNLYLTGYYQSTVDFDVSSSTFNLTSNGTDDVFIAKFKLPYTSIPEGLSFNNCSVFPNPNQGLVNINLGSLRDVSISIYNSGMQLIYEKDNINTSLYQFKLDVPKGIYFIEIGSANDKHYQKLIVN